MLLSRDQGLFLLSEQLPSEITTILKINSHYKVITSTITLLRMCSNITAWPLNLSFPRVSS